MTEQKRRFILRVAMYVVKKAVTGPRNPVLKLF